MERREFWGYSYLAAVVAIGAILFWNYDQVMIFNRVAVLIFLGIGWLILALLAGPIVFVVARLAKTPALAAWGDTTLAIGLMLLFFHAFYLFHSANPANFATAKAYARLAEPALEEYYAKHHHYPMSLTELGLSQQPPFGLFYMANNSGPLEWGTHKHVVVEKSNVRGADYQIEFGDWYYRGEGDWNQGGI